MFGDLWRIEDGKALSRAALRKEGPAGFEPLESVGREGTTLVCCWGQSTFNPSCLVSPQGFSSLFVFTPPPHSFRTNTTSNIPNLLVLARFLIVLFLHFCCLSRNWNRRQCIDTICLQSEPLHEPHVLSVLPLISRRHQVASRASENISLSQVLIASAR